jgi:hypothetical protein
MDLRRNKVEAFDWIRLAQGNVTWTTVMGSMTAGNKPKQVDKICAGHQPCRSDFINFSSREDFRSRCQRNRQSFEQQRKAVPVEFVMFACLSFRGSNTRLASLGARTHIVAGYTCQRPAYVIKCPRAWLCQDVATWVVVVVEKWPWEAVHQSFLGSLSNTGPVCHLSVSQSTASTVVALTCGSWLVTSSAPIFRVEIWAEQSPGKSLLSR